MLRNPQDRELALECLRLASANQYQSDPTNILAVAGRFFEFVSGDPASEALRTIRAIVA